MTTTGYWLSRLRSHEFLTTVVDQLGEQAFYKDAQGELLVLTHGAMVCASVLAGARATAFPIFKRKRLVSVCIHHDELSADMSGEDFFAQWNAVVAEVEADAGPGLQLVGNDPDQIALPRNKIVEFLHLVPANGFGVRTTGVYAASSPALIVAMRDSTIKPHSISRVRLPKAVTPGVLSAVR